ncbi:unnamed protein product [Adineta ricciae]|uniref:Uncharacterized protein n=1 Tax=Adineta ricciae TaxID=249248 RepID=A0A815QJ44_ADIRI|nr:unnamed protein product [Adineta ricciae]
MLHTISWNNALPKYNITYQQCQCLALTESVIGWNHISTHETCHMIHNYSENDVGLIDSTYVNYAFQKFLSKPSVLTTELTIVGKLNLTSSALLIRKFLLDQQRSQTDEFVYKKRKKNLTTEVYKYVPLLLFVLGFHEKITHANRRSPT